MATGDIPIPLELCHAQCLVRAGDTDCSLPAFPLMKELRRKSPSTPRSTTEVSGAIAYHVYCQDLQEAMKLKKKLEKGSKRCISLLLIARAAPEARLSCSLSQLVSLLEPDMSFLSSALLLQSRSPLESDHMGRVAFRSLEL